MLLKNLPRFALNNRTRAIIWFLFLSLFLHLIIADLFFEYGFQRRMVNFVQEIAKTMAPEEQKVVTQQKIDRRQALIEAFKALQPNKEKRKAKLVAPKGNFGWTLFDAPPSAKKSYGRQEIPTNTQGDIAIAATTHATEDVTQIQLEDVPECTTETPVSESEKEGEKERINSNTKARFPDLDSVETMVRESTAMPTPTKNIDIAERLINKGAAEPVEEISAAQRIAQIDRMQSIIASGGMQSLTKPKFSSAKATADMAKKGTGPRRTMVRGAALEDPETGKPRSIIALTKGFIEKFDGEDGHDLIDRDGDPNIQPDLEDMKLITYESKLFWCLQGAWNQNYKHRTDLNFPEGVAYIDYTVDRGGKLVTCELLQSTGHAGLDNAILKTFKIAAPFPPFPSSFNTETYRSGQRISVHHQRYAF